MSTISIKHPFNMSYDMTPSQNIEVLYRAKVESENDFGEIERTHILKTYEIVDSGNGIYLRKKELQHTDDDGNTLHSKK